MKYDISIVIPFHNEEDSLKYLLPLLINEIKKFNKKFQIILVDDISDDNSIKIVQGIINKNDFIKLIELKKRSGQTGCYKEALKIVNSKYIIRMDADLQDDPKDLYKFIDKIDQDYDLIMGLRECRKHSRVIRLATGFYDLLIILFFNSPLHSNSGSYVAFKTDYLKNINFKKNDHRYFPLITMKRGAKKIGEVFVTHNERKYGKSKYKPIKKVICGVPEVICFLIRYLYGYYDFK